MQSVSSVSHSVSLSEVEGWAYTLSPEDSFFVSVFSLSFIHSLHLSSSYPISLSIYRQQASVKFWILLKSSNRQSISPSIECVERCFALESIVSSVSPHLER